MVNVASHIKPMTYAVPKIAKTTANTWTLEEKRCDAKAIYEALIGNNAESLSSACLRAPPLDLDAEEAVQLQPLLHRSLSNRLARLIVGGEENPNEEESCSGVSEPGSEEAHVKKMLDNATLPKAALLETLSRRIESQKGWAQFRVGCSSSAFSSQQRSRSMETALT